MTMTMMRNAIGLSLLLSGPAAADPGLVKAADCVGWFESWATETKASMAQEHKMATELKLEPRPVAEVQAPVDDVVTMARRLCARLETQKVKASNEQTAKPARCAEAFSRWEDEMDQAYAMAVFERKKDLGDKTYVSAQEIARREAKFGKFLCSLMGKLH